MIADNIPDQAQRKKVPPLFWRRLYGEARTRADFWIWHSARFGKRHSIVLAVLCTLSAVVVTSVAVATWLVRGGKDWAYHLDTTADVYTSGGAALFSATAIVSSIVLFSLQANFERTPYGLFKKLSADARLLSLFAIAFLASGSIVIASAFLTKSTAPWLNFASAWAVVITLGALLWSYRRALTLMSPIEQMNYLLRRVVRNCQVWERRAKRARPVIEHAAGSVPKLESNFDAVKSVYWLRHPHWVHELERALHNFTALAGTYANNGDHQISGQAINAIPELLKAYIQTRRGTFFPENPIYQTGNSTDAFINKVLENLKIQFEMSLKRDDEEHCEHCITAMSRSAQVLAHIDYGSAGATKMHATLATAYLTEAMKRVIADKKPDLALHAIRQANYVASILVQLTIHQEIRSVIDPIGDRAILPGLVDKGMLPVTVEAVNKLSQITLMMIGGPNVDAGRAFNKLHELICTMFPVSDCETDRPNCLRRISGTS